MLDPSGKRWFRGHAHTRGYLSKDTKKSLENRQNRRRLAPCDSLVGPMRRRQDGPTARPTVGATPIACAVKSTNMESKSAGKVCVLSGFARLSTCCFRASGKSDSVGTLTTAFADVRGYCLIRARGSLRRGKGRSKRGAGVRVARRNQLKSAEMYVDWSRVGTRKPPGALAGFPGHASTRRRSFCSVSAPSPAVGGCN